MIDISTWLLVITTVVFSIWILRSQSIFSFLGFTVGIFFIFVLPKTFLYHLYGNTVFLAQNVNFTPLHVNSALIVILLFILGIVISYTLPIGWLTTFTKKIASSSLQIQKEIKVSDTISLYIIFPLFFISFVAYIWAIYKVDGHIFHKTTFTYNGEISPAYIMLKIVQVIKISFYLYFIQLISIKEKIPMNSKKILILAILFTIAIFLVAGHRSGIIILFLQIVLFSKYMGWIKNKHIIWAIIALVGLNIFILFFRESTENTQYQIINFLRRYFFEIEKISGLIMEDNLGQLITSPWMSLIDTSSQIHFTGSSHHYLGNHILQSKSAVGPTILGDIIIYLGSAFVFPLALLLGYIMRIIEKITFSSSNGLIVAIGITAISIGEFLLLNTDTWAFIKRFIFESGLIFMAYMLLKIKFPNPFKSKIS